MINLNHLVFLLSENDCPENQAEHVEQLSNTSNTVKQEVLLCYL